MSLCEDCLPECEHDYCDNCTKCHECGQYAGAPAAPMLPPDTGIGKRRDWIKPNPLMSPSLFNDRFYDTYLNTRANTSIQLH